MALLLAVQSWPLTIWPRFSPKKKTQTVRVAQVVQGRARQKEQTELAPGWGGERQRRHYDAQMQLAHQREVASDRFGYCNRTTHLPRPRIYVYELPPDLVPPPTLWRMVRALKLWVEHSAYHETNPHCADFFLVPSHPQNRIRNPNGSSFIDRGDLAMARIFGYIRQRYPFWNRTVAKGVARHFMLLPCDHGPGDCGFTRPLVPNKYAPQEEAATKGRSGGARRTRRIWAGMNVVGGEEIEATWGNGWEAINPASPGRFVFYLMYNGWADGLRANEGACLNCFNPGLDIRLPTPEGHECGVSCGLHHVFNKSSGTSWYIPTELQRILVRRAASRSPTVQAALGGGSRSVLGRYSGAIQGHGGAMTISTRRECLFSWHGAVRGRNNPTRTELLNLADKPAMCVTNTARGSKLPGDKPMPSIPANMLRSRFCYSPRGWDQGDSDRYLPSLLYGCIPVMSDRLEAMPLDELPEMQWNSYAL